MLGLIDQLDPQLHQFESIDCWSYDGLLAKLPEQPWLHKHSLGRWQKNLGTELLWERFVLPKSARAKGIDLLFNVSAGAVCRFEPSMTMSQDMLSYEPGEMDRYAYGRDWWRLLALRYVQNAALRRASGAIFLTDYAASMIQQSCGQLDRLAIVPHGIHAAFFELPAASLTAGAFPAMIRCLYVSHTHLYKHQWHVVDAVAQLNQRGQSLELSLVGGGSGESQARLLAQLAKSDPMRRFIQLTDFVSREEIARHLAEADIFIFASSCENMPITLLEAMAAGRVIACSDRGPMPAVLQDGGVYFDPEDPGSIAAAIEGLISDPAKAARLAARAKVLASQYSWKRCADETFDFLHAILDRPKTPRISLKADH